jgi:hypothetical protein
MAFTGGLTNDFGPIGAGERYGDVNIILTSDDFQDGLRVGRFAQLDNGKLLNTNGFAGPLLAGVVLRNVAAPIEDGGIVDGSLYRQVEYMRQGLVTVDVKVGEKPEKFGQVFVDDNTGEALSAGGTQARAEFIEKVGQDVWLIRLY